MANSLTMQPTVSRAGSQADEVESFWAFPQASSNVDGEFWAVTCLSLISFPVLGCDI